MASVEASFSSLVGVAEAIAATRKRLDKAAFLAAYLANLDDDCLRLAARYMAGQPFPLWDQRTTQVGGAALLSTLSRLSGMPLDTLKEKLVILGDVGDLAAAVLPERPVAGPSLVQVQVALEALASSRGATAKTAVLARLLTEAPPQQGKYLVKLVMGELRIGLKEGAVEDALARMAHVPVEEVQWANMLVGDLGETAVLARHGALSGVAMRLFHPLKFMLATPAADAADVGAQMPETFVVEDKYDGIRAQAHVTYESPDEAALPKHGVLHANVRVALFSRTLDEITGSFPDLVAPLAALLTPGGPRSLMLDGELVAVRGAQVLPFATLQTRLGRKKPSAALLEAVPVALVAYDILYANAVVLLQAPQQQRRAQLIQALPQDQAGAVRCAPSTLVCGTTQLDALFAAARARGNEGLMLKNPAAAYKPGRRGRDWLKLKRAMATLDVVVTAAEVGYGKRRKWLSDYTFAVRQSDSDPALLNIGKAYSGLTEAEIAELTVWFEAHTLQTFAHGKVRTVEPQIVLEVTFDQVQKSPRHKSGYALRFPRIVRLRPDKTVADIDTLEMVARLAQTC